MAKNWVIVADSASAKIFSVAGPTAAKLKEVETLSHPEGRMRAGEIEADRPGRAFQSAGSMRHGMERSTDTKKHAVAAFARQLAARLESARLQNGLARVILVASGVSRLAARPSERRDAYAGAGEFALNLTGMKSGEIRAHLPEKLYNAIDAR